MTDTAQETSHRVVDAPERPKNGPQQRGHSRTSSTELPLGYVDRQPRGDLLSRVTNDIDNVAQSLQQTLSQLLTSVLTIVGVLVMMFTISPQLAIVALTTVPLSCC
jgi:ATP-binding cassette subfamily B multidrug efflux pump